MEVEPAGFTGRVDSPLIPVAQQRNSEIICKRDSRESEMGLFFFFHKDAKRIVLGTR